MTLSLFFDAIICVGLIAGFFYTLWFNKKLNSVQNSRQQFQHLLDTFSNALERGQNSLSQLQEVNARIVRELDQKMGNASLIVDDLSFFIDRGESAMKQLETHVRSARAINQDFEALIQTKEDKVHLLQKIEEKEPTAYVSEQELSRLKEEKLFKTDVRVDHPWGTLKDKRTLLDQGGRYL